MNKTIVFAVLFAIITISAANAGIPHPYACDKCEIEGNIYIDYNKCREFSAGGYKWTGCAQYKCVDNPPFEKCWEFKGYNMKMNPKNTTTRIGNQDWPQRPASVHIGNPNWPELPDRVIITRP